MKNNTTEFKNEALANLARYPSSQILIGSTPITQIAAPLKVANSERL